MGFIENIKQCFDECELPREPIFRAVLFGDSSAYFENVSGISCYSKEQIILQLKRGGIKITGENLYIKKFCMGDIAICGKILALERV